jgi:hypothetical protein
MKWRKVRGKFLGHLIYLEAKTKGENSMSEKQRILESAKGIALGDPRDMVKAILLES